nr:MAG TPA: hypothetical protein [Caudoviricetes sp.]
MKRLKWMIRTLLLAVLIPLEEQKNCGLISPIIMESTFVVTMCWVARASALFTAKQAQKAFRCLKRLFLHAVVAVNVLFFLVGFAIIFSVYGYKC